MVELSSRKNLSKHLDTVLHILALHETLRGRKIIYTLNKDPVRTSEGTPYDRLKVSRQYKYSCIPLGYSNTKTAP